MEFIYSITKEERKIRIMELVNGFMDALGLDQEQEVTWISYVTFLLAFSMCFFNGKNVLESLVCTLGILLIGFLVVLIVKRIVRNFLLSVLTSSGVFLGVIVFLTSCFGILSVKRLIGGGNLTFSWWGLFIYLPYILGKVKNVFAAIIRFFRNGWRCMDHSGTLEEKTEKFFIWIFILMVVILMVVTGFAGIGMFVFDFAMCSLCLVRGFTELIRVMDKWIPKNKLY